MMANEESGVNHGNSDEEPNFHMSDIFIAPWGLANEQRPIHILWEGKINSLRLQLPNPLQFDEINNLSIPVDEVEIVNYQEENYKEVRIDGDDLHSQGYLAGELVASSIFEDVMVGQEIGVSFELPNGAIIESTEYTFTIRPEIELVDAPEQLILDESNSDSDIDIDMRYVGFGMAEVEIEVQSGGEIISEPEDLLTDVARAMSESGIAKKDSDYLEDIPEDWNNETGYDISREDLQLVAEDMREFLLEGEEVFEEFDVDELLQIAKALEEGETDKEWDISKMYEFLELALVNSILDIVDRHPTEGVKMENPNTEIETDENTTELTVVYKLEDKNENEYEPVEHTVEIIDRREQNSMLRGEVNTNWESLRIDPNKVLKEIMEEL